MRKDVRMGFAVGGVLLAVIIVAVLVFHRNHSKQVVFDPGNGQAAAPSADQASVDVAAAPDTSAKSGSSSATAAAAANADASAGATPQGAQPPPDTAVASSKSSDRWDALFASAQDPVKSQLTTSARRSHHQTATAAPGSSGNATAANVPLSNTVEPAQPVDLAAPDHTRSEASARTGHDAATSRGRTHKVELGETMVSIARAAYGDGRYYVAIASANPSVNPNRLHRGDVLQLPPAAQVKQASRRRSDATTVRASAVRSSGARDGTTYVVQKGDSLYSIAHKLHGGAAKQDELYQLNKQTIGPDSTKLKIGMVLKLPAGSR